MIWLIWLTWLTWLIIRSLKNILFETCFRELALLYSSSTIFIFYLLFFSKLQQSLFLLLIFFFLTENVISVVWSCLWSETCLMLQMFWAQMKTSMTCPFMSFRTQTLTWVCVCLDRDTSARSACRSSRAHTSCSGTAARWSPAHTGSSRRCWSSALRWHSHTHLYSPDHRSLQNTPRYTWGGMIRRHLLIGSNGPLCSVVRRWPQVDFCTPVSHEAISTPALSGDRVTSTTVVTNTLLRTVLSKPPIRTRFCADGTLQRNT